MTCAPMTWLLVDSLSQSRPHLPCTWTPGTNREVPGRCMLLVSSLSLKSSMRLALIPVIEVQSEAGADTGHQIFFPSSSLIPSPLPHLSLVFSLPLPLQPNLSSHCICAIRHVHVVLLVQLGENLHCLWR